MPAAKYDIEIEQGAAFALPLRFVSGTSVPESIAGTEVYGQIRADYDDEEVLAEFSCGVTSAAERRIYAALAAATTATIPRGAYRYDIFCQFDGLEPIRLLTGKATVKPRVTRTA